MVKTHKYTYIDSIRGYAVLMVLLRHIYAEFCAKSWGQIFLSNFWVQCRMGVMLFFMISALTLFLSMDKKMSTESGPIKNFYIRRFFRIAPLFYLVIICNILVKDYTIYSVISTFLFVNGFIPDVFMSPIVGGGWTIAVEMIFYLLAPILFVFINKIQKALIFFCGTLVFNIVANHIVMSNLGHIYSNITLIGFTYYWLPLQLPVFALGILIYFLLFKTDISKNFEPKFKHAIGYILIFCSIYFTVVLSYSSKLFIYENVAFSVPLMIFILGMAINPDTVFNNKAIRLLGKISYSFYLVHIVIIDLIKHFWSKNIFPPGNWGFILAAVIVFVATLIISYVSYLTIEQPFQKLGSKLIVMLEKKSKIKAAKII